MERTKNAPPIVATQIFATFVRECRKGIEEKTLEETYNIAVGLLENGYYHLAIDQFEALGELDTYNLKKDDTGKWSKGYIIDPESGNRYKCKITFRKADGKKYKTDTLEMRGELALGIGRSQFWTRASEEEAKNIR